MDVIVKLILYNIQIVFRNKPLRRRLLNIINVLQVQRREH